MSHANIHDVPIILKGLSGGGGGGSSSDIEIEWMNQRSVQFDITEPKNHNCIDVHRVVRVVHNSEGAVDFLTNFVQISVFAPFAKNNVQK